MIVEFKISIKEPAEQPGSWTESTGDVHISASKRTIDKIIKAIESVPNVEVL